MVTNTATNIHEIADGIDRINTPISIPGGPGSFNFNQYLIVDEEPMLFHTGLRSLFDGVQEAIARVIPLRTLKYIGVSHFESDECGALNNFLAAAPQAVPICSRVGAMVSLGDFADRPPRALADGEDLSLGRHTVRWFDTPQVPHGWDCGLMLEISTRTFLCGDLFTQGGTGEIPLTESDILGPSEAFRKPMDYFAHAPQTTAILSGSPLSDPPRSPACTAVHGGAMELALLRELATAIG